MKSLGTLARAKGIALAGLAVLALAALGCRGDAPEGRAEASRSPGAQPDIVEALRADLAADRHSSALFEMKCVGLQLVSLLRIPGELRSHRPLVRRREPPPPRELCRNRGSIPTVPV